MGQGSSTDNASSKESLKDCLLRYSGKAAGSAPEKITLEGIQAYMTSNDAFLRNHYAAREDKVNSYKTIASLTREVGMSEDRQYELCLSAYRNLNRYAGKLSAANIPEPVAPGQAKSVASSSNAEQSKLPQAVRRDLQGLLDNPHSFFALGGRDIKSYENCDPKLLTAAIKADQSFVQNSAAHWSLPPDQAARNTLADRWRDHLNSPQARNEGGVGATNAVPFEAIKNAQTELSNAIKGGYDIRLPQAQADFAQVALSVNLAINASHTLAGRGTDSITEQTMMFSPDGHSNKSSAPRFM
ncbi:MULTISPECIES: hypothetical protein [Lysobacter]|uniref:Uncharacterized protein n=1 Tax=Lysobacter firmicutimachus TaxID=1792846 RepID=A0ABU8D3X2_9GAMM|nr:hypothetical protein [Lysobacter antibioticus]